MTYQCIGCGASIQAESPDQPGYLPASALEKGVEKGEFYCQRCFRLRHYNELQDLTLSDQVFLDKLSAIAQDDALIIKVVDIFDVEGSLIHGLSRFIGHQPFVVFGNKFDLLPKVTREHRVKHWLKGILQENGLYPQDILLGSAHKRQTLGPLLELIEANIHERNIYIVGVTNVGKSTLLNQLLRHYGSDREIITTSNHPGTTLDLIHIPLTEEHALIDTPGIIHRTQLAHYLSRAGMQQLLPSKPFKPVTFQLNSQQTIFLAGVGRVDFESGERTSFTFYVSQQCYLHRTKLAKADAFYAQHQGGLLTPPSMEEVASFPRLVPKTIRLAAHQDVAISGLGWFSVNGPVVVTVWVPQGVAVTVRDAII